MPSQAKPEILLASRSPRRRELLDLVGVPYAPIDVTIDESAESDESPEVLVLRLALAKARAGFQAGGGLCPVLGADTVVVADEEILGKPNGRLEGLAMLERLSGASHTVLSGVALVDDREATRLSVSHVTFREMGAEERERYWATGEGADKAGAYGIQGRASVFVTHLDGSYSGVMGLPLFETTELLQEFAIDYQRHW